MVQRPLHDAAVHDAVDAALAAAAAAFVTAAILYGVVIRVVAEGAPRIFGAAQPPQTLQQEG